MPPRAAPGDQAAILEALTPTLRAGLAQLRELLDVDDWQRSPLGAPFVQAAVVLLAARIGQEEGMAEREALDAAAIRLGVSPDTARDRARRWPKESRPGVDYPPCRSSEGALRSGDSTDSTPHPEPER